MLSTIFVMTSVLIAGSGGREFELGRSFLESDLAPEVHYAYANGAMQYPYLDVLAHDIPPTPEAFAHLAYDLEVDLAVVSSERQLDRDYIGHLEKEGISAFGPNASSARHETSKAYGADFCERHGIAKPKHQTVEDIDEAIAVIVGRDPESYVIKADGLADGKGVILPKTEEEARRELHKLMVDGAYAGGGLERVVIQERFHGPEVSMFIVMDGNGGYSVLPFVQDHKRIGEGDYGPNTGGMGAYLPIDDLLTDRQRKKLREMADQIVAGMQKDATAYAGVMYAGIMLAEELDDDPAVFEFNVRWGDPETQVQMPVLTASGVDVLQMHLAAARGELALPRDMTRSELAGITVALARAGYPEAIADGSQPIYGIDSVSGDVILQYAGVTIDGMQLRAQGGRVAYVTALADNLDEAAATAYAAIGANGIHFEGMQYRRDIGHLLRPDWLAIARSKQ